jgi:hypothetical protein
MPLRTLILLVLAFALVVLTILSGKPPSEGLPAFVLAFALVVLATWRYLRLHGGRWPWDRGE